MQTHSNGIRNGCRSRSPIRAISGMMQQGDAIQFFHKTDPAAKQGAALVRTSAEKSWFLQTHGWLDGQLQEPFDPALLDPKDEKTWPLVLPRKDIPFVDKAGKKLAKPQVARRCLYVREVSQKKPPLLSIVIVRWGGGYSAWMDEEEANDGDWGKYGSPPSDSYMAALAEQGFFGHPQLNPEGENGVGQPVFEVFGLFVASTRDVALLGASSQAIASMLKGKRKAAFWMLWPAEWEDTGDPDFACYIERQGLFAGMRALETAGIRSAFPHPSDLFEEITSKSWMATLSLNPAARLPACTMVSRDAIKSDPKEAARQALLSMEHIRRMCPFPNSPDDPPAPSVVNKDAVTKGMVKVGWSWENRFVLCFTNEKHLQQRLSEMIALPGCLASYCIVQEWVDFDFEMRLYFLMHEEWEPGSRLEPTRIECNKWGHRDERGSAGSPAASFSKVSHEKALELWDKDTVAWEDAQKQAIDVSQFLMSWLRCVGGTQVPMIRLDFMLKRVGPGRARVIFGEFCEIGACCLGWTEGPPTIWKVVLDHVLRGS